MHPKGFEPLSPFEHQILILATGNYGIFNGLTFALVLWLLDDQSILSFPPSHRCVNGRWPSSYKPQLCAKGAISGHLLVDTEM